MNIIPTGAYRSLQKLQPSSLLNEFVSRAANGCLQIFSGGSTWLVHLEQGKLIYATDLSDPFGRLDRHLRRIHVQALSLVSAVRVQVRLMFESPTADQPDQNSDYRAICWLVEQQYLTPEQAAFLIEGLAQEVIESFLPVQIGSYEWIEQDPLADFPKFCRLDLPVLIATGQQQLRQRQAASIAERVTERMVNRFTVISAPTGSTPTGSTPTGSTPIRLNRTTGFHADASGSETSASEASTFETSASETGNTASFSDAKISSSVPEISYSATDSEIDSETDTRREFELNSQPESEFPGMSSSESDSNLDSSDNSTTAYSAKTNVTALRLTSANGSGAKVAESSSVEPSLVEPSLVEPASAEPNSVESNLVESNSSESSVSYLRSSRAATENPRANQPLTARSTGHLTDQSFGQSIGHSTKQSTGHSTGQSTGQSTGATSESDRSYKTYRIACIDDSPAVLEAISSYLDDKSFSVVLISDPVKALMQIIRNKPDLILLDVTMPQLDGYELCSLLRKHPHFRWTPVIMVTSNTGFIDRAKAKLVGSSGYLTKPFTQTDLVKIIFKHLN